MSKINFEICNSRRAGFTLIEILVSLALLVIVLGVIYSSFFTVHSALERFDDVSLKYHEVRTVLDLMRREVEGAFLSEYKAQPSTSSVESNTELRTYFQIEDRDIFGKTTSRLHLTAFSFKGNGLSTISYYVQEEDEQLTLIKAESPAVISLTGKAQTGGLSARWYILEMVEGIESFTVETLYNNKWVKTWNTKETGSLPEVVRFSIEFDDKGKKVKLTEYARPKIGKQL